MRSLCYCYCYRPLQQRAGQQAFDRRQHPRAQPHRWRRHVEICYGRGCREDKACVGVMMVRDASEASMQAHALPAPCTAPSIQPYPLSLSRARANSSPTPPTPGSHTHPQKPASVLPQARTSMLLLLQQQRQRPHLLVLRPPLLLSVLALHDAHHAFDHAWRLCVCVCVRALLAIRDAYTACEQASTQEPRATSCKQQASPCLPVPHPLSKQHAARQHESAEQPQRHLPPPA